MCSWQDRAGAGEPAPELLCPHAGSSGLGVCWHATACARTLGAGAWVSEVEQCQTRARPGQPTACFVDASETAMPSHAQAIAYTLSRLLL